MVKQEEKTNKSMYK